MKSLIIKNAALEDVKKHPNYLEALKWVKDANADLCENSKKIELILKDLPSMTVSRPATDHVFNLTKHLLGMLLIEVEIEKQSFRFLLDTGAQMSCIRGTLAEQLSGLKNLDMVVEVGDASGYKSNMDLCQLENLKFYDVQVYQATMLSLHSDQLSFKILGKKVQLDGIIGWDILRHLDFELDLNRNLVLLTHTDDNVSNLIPSDFPVVLLTDQTGEIRKFGLDLGAKKSWINEKMVSDVGLKVYESKNKMMYGAHGLVKNHMQIVGPYTLHLATHQLKFKRIQTGFTAFINDYELDGILGLDIIKKHKIRIYNHQGVMELISYENRLL